MEKKMFESPELTIINFIDSDIILTSGEFDEDEWGDNPPGGDF